MKAPNGDNTSSPTTITAELKIFAKENDVIVIAVSQLNRVVETRGGDKRPQLSDLKGSESIEEDAGKVIFAYRPGCYSITIDENGRIESNVLDLIMAKNKNGKLGTICLLLNINFIPVSD